MLVQDKLLAWAEGLAGAAPLVPYYHVVSDEQLPHIRHLYPYKNRLQFAGDLDFFCRFHRPLSLPDLIESVKSGRKVQRGRVLLTFDDGFSQIESVVAPLLLKKGIPAVFFLTTGFLDNQRLGHSHKASLIVEDLMENESHQKELARAVTGYSGLRLEDQIKRILALRFAEEDELDRIASWLGIDFDAYLAEKRPFLTEEQVRALIARGFSIGAHSLDHPYFGDLSLSDQLHQTLASMQALRDRFDLSYSVFAFPHDDRSVTDEFFRRTAASLDLTFGTSGPGRGIAATHIQRINFERSQKPASRILARTLVKAALGRTGGSRPDR